MRSPVAGSCAPRNNHSGFRRFPWIGPDNVQRFEAQMESPDYINPLRKFERPYEGSSLDAEDKTPVDFSISYSSVNDLKATLGSLVYSFKNTIQRPWLIRKLRSLDSEHLELPDVLCWGQRGFGTRVLLKALHRKIGRPETVGCFGCGTGAELILVAKYLRPKYIIGYEYFNYERAWKLVSDAVRHYGIEIAFHQVDLRNPLRLDHQCDTLVSFAVLEHLSEINQVLRHLRPLLKPGGSFASCWGPMWYSYSGDHIAAELGMEFGFEHLRLSASDYFEWYREHPRNRDGVLRGQVTWLELGLTNYSRYCDYLSSITQIFGPQIWLQWQISSEAFDYKRQFGDR